MRNPLASSRLKLRQLFVKGLLLTIMAAAVLASDFWIVSLRERTKGDDFFQFWAAGKAILQGSDPYQPQAWRQIYEQEGRWRWQTDQPAFIYPLWTAFPFVPLATLPVIWAALLWAVISQLLVALSAMLIIRALNWSSFRQWLPLMLVVLMTFEPLLLTLLFGQLGIMLLVLLCGVSYLASHGHHALGGILLALTLAKLQLFILVIPALLLVMLLERKWSFIASFSITVMVLTICSWLVVPQWPLKWRSYLAQTAEVRLTISPTIWGFSHTVLGALRRLDLWLVVSLSVCLLVVGVTGCVLYIKRSAFRTGERLTLVLSLITIVSLLATPYMLSYDFALLLLPVITCFWLIQSLPRPVRCALLASLVACGVCLPWALLLVSAQTGLETATMLFPTSLLAILLIATVAKHPQAVLSTVAGGFREPGRHS